MKCLRCETEMVKIMNGDVEVDICMDGCGGIWFDPFELKKMNERSEITADFMKALGQANRKTVDKKPRLTCPQCGAKMLRHFHSVRREVEIDQCSQCYGHWLDGGELIKVIGQFKDQEDHNKATIEFFKRLKS